MTSDNARDSIAIYQSADGEARIEVRLDEDTVWLSLDRMAELFDRDKSTVSRHIRNVFAEEELDASATVAKFATVQTEGNRAVERQIDYYNLDVIISVGYRVKSLRGTQFRQWASRVLKQHIVEGYTVNSRRLEQLNKAIEILSRSVAPEIAGLSGILRQFTSGLDLLDKYDHQSIAKPEDKKTDGWVLTYEEARAFIASMRFGEESPLFGSEYNESFKGTLGAIYQSFGGKDLYPGVFEKAVNLLYLTVKNHSFIDGNKRIAAALFVYFLDKSNTLRNERNALRIDSNTLAAATLMIALSKPEEKEIMCALVMQMLVGGQGS
jgi:prophage maintenance system killer protein